MTNAQVALKYAVKYASIYINSSQLCDWKLYADDMFNWLNTKDQEPKLKAEEELKEKQSKCAHEFKSCAGLGTTGYISGSNLQAYQPQAICYRYCSKCGYSEEIK